MSLTSPFDQSPITFSPKTKPLIQLTLTFTVLLACYFAYYSVDIIQKDMPFVATPDHVVFSIPSWTTLLFPLLAIIPGVYVYLFLYYNVG